ncbi:hypothetical protein D9613_006570 [Agrocybe pediades]|uniref:Uncharacterized protein n=1 Tax=Agrocybe pediades TaxID=84607 RepID=A0A8H4QHB6_9AGAR|nr:hypothetical protein D9613_006570 [Agrocybe pediades]
MAKLTSIFSAVLLFVAAAAALPAEAEAAAPAVATDVVYHCGNGVMLMSPSCWISGYVRTFALAPRIPAVDLFWKASVELAAFSSQVKPAFSDRGVERPTVL